MRKYLILVITFLTLKTLNASTTSGVIYSPNGLSSAEYVGSKINVIYKGEKKIYPTSQLEAPLMWAPDSNHLIIISHIAHGETISIINTKGNSMYSKDISPPIENEQLYRDANKISSMVHSVKLAGNAISIVYYVAFKFQDKENLYNSYSYNYDISNNQIINLTKRSITQKEFY
jgi:hypothetical protein